MTTTTYDFDTQFAQGETGEDYLDRRFAPWYTIRPATRTEQRQGIDRWYTRISNGETFPVEYKTDRTAGRTGNAFVETISVDTANKLGWAYTSKARYLIYRIPEPEVIYIIPMAELRYRVDAWKARYPERTIPNNTYNTVGTLVPLDEFERIAVAVT